MHEDDTTVVPRVSDLLIEGGKIAKVEDKIAIPTNDVNVINCEGKIISPGFISTHHHLWQTQLKGRYSDHTLLEYMASGNRTGTLYSLEDAFWGELSGAMEAIDAGTTTVVDHSSLNIGPEYRKPSYAFP